MRVWKLQGPWNDLAALHSLQRGISRFGGAASGHIYRCLSQEKSIILNAVHTYEGYSALWGCHQHDVSNKTGLSPSASTASTRVYADRRASLQTQGALHSSWQALQTEWKSAATLHFLGLARAGLREMPRGPCSITFRVNFHFSALPVRRPSGRRSAVCTREHNGPIARPDSPRRLAGDNPDFLVSSELARRRPLGRKAFRSSDPSVMSAAVLPGRGSQVRVPAENNYVLQQACVLSARSAAEHTQNDVS